MSRQSKIGTSATAVWSLRLALLSWPSTLITAAGHRFELITFEQTAALIAATWLLALAAVCLGVYAVVVIWQQGHHGGWSALGGLLCGSVTLAPAALGFAAALYYPVLNDISTDRLEPPEYMVAQHLRSPYDHPLGTPEPSDLERQELGYPDLQGRRFRLATTTVYASAERVAGSRFFWTITDRRPPEDETAEGAIEIVVPTPLFAFRDDVVIRIMPDENGSRLDIRSASRRGTHDFGANARRIDYLLDAIEKDLSVNR